MNSERKTLDCIVYIKTFEESTKPIFNLPLENLISMAIIKSDCDTCQYSLSCSGNYDRVLELYTSFKNSKL